MTIEDLRAKIAQRAESRKATQPNEAMMKAVANAAAKWKASQIPEPSNFEKDTAKNDKADAAAYKSTVTSVSRGMTPNAQDISNLKQLAAGSKTPEEQAVLKAASFGHRLNPEQVAIIKQVAARL